MSQVATIRESSAPRSAECAAVVREPGFHLLVESLACGARPAARTAADLPVLAVPAGVTQLAPDRDPLALVPAAQAGSDEPAAGALVLEPVTVGGRARLLLLTPAGLHARLNGAAVPALALLEVGDQLQLGGRAVLHVTEYRRAGAVSPPAKLVGSPCGVCRLPLTAETTVHICRCGLPLHLEGPPKPESERLECALFGDCPTCGSEVRTEGGHAWLPEL